LNFFDTPIGLGFPVDGKKNRGLWDVRPLSAVSSPNLINYGEDFK